MLKKALLEEQQKSVITRETLRQRDTSLRRAEQEVDSLGFRNKQLEQRVVALQDDLQRQTKTPTKSSSRSNKASSGAEINHVSNIPLIEEELQKKIIENAELSSLVADQKSEALLLTQRIQELELSIAQDTAEQSEKEQQLRKDLCALTAKYSSLEIRYSETSGSIMGSDDALSMSENEISLGINEMHGHSSHQHQQLSQKPSVSSRSVRCSQEVAELEREVFRLKTLLDCQSICDLSDKALEEKKQELRRASTGPVGAPWTVSKRETDMKASTSSSSELMVQSEDVTRVKLMFQYFTERLDRMFNETAVANSKAANYITEVRSQFRGISCGNLL